MSPKITSDFPKNKRFIQTILGKLCLSLFKMYLEGGIYTCFCFLHDLFTGKILGKLLFSGYFFLPKEALPFFSSFKMYLEVCIYTCFSFCMIYLQGKRRHMTIYFCLPMSSTGLLWVGTKHLRHLYPYNAFCFDWFLNGSFLIHRLTVFWRVIFFFLTKKPDREKKDIFFCLFFCCELCS